MTQNSQGTSQASPSVWQPEDIINYRECAAMMFAILAKRRREGEKLTGGETQFFKAFRILEQRKQRSVLPNRPRRESFKAERDYSNALDTYIDALRAHYKLGQGQ